MFVGENDKVFRKYAVRSFRAALLASVFFGANASADSLTDAFVKAYQSNPQLLAERANLRATDEDVAQAIAQWRPKVELSGSYALSRSERKVDPPPVPIFEEDKGRSWRGTISATQSVFAGGRILAARRQADASVRAGRAVLHATEQAIFLDTVSAYMNVVRDGAVLSLNQANVELLKKQLEAAQARFEVGEITRTDVAQAEARLSAGQSGLTAAEASLKASRLFYERTVGETPGTLDSKPPTPPLPESEEESRRLANQLNPNLIATREAEEAARAGVDAAVSEMMPALSVQASYSRFGEERAPEAISDDASVAAVATVPLYQGGQEWSAIRQAKERNNRARLDVEDARRGTDEGVSNAWESYRAAKASSEANRQQVKAAEIAFEGVQQELEVGSRTTLDVLNQQQELLNARVALVRSERDEIVASYGLLAAVGKLTAKELQLPVQLYDPTENYHMQTWRPLGSATYDD